MNLLFWKVLRAKIKVYMLFLQLKFSSQPQVVREDVNFLLIVAKKLLPR